jgi:hypothetical protein
MHTRASPFFSFAIPRLLLVTFTARACMGRSLPQSLLKVHRVLLLNRKNIPELLR